MTVSAWLDDAALVDHQVAYENSQSGDCWIWVSSSDATGDHVAKLGQAWNLTGGAANLTGPTASAGNAGMLDVGNDSSDQATWGACWLTLQVADASTVTVASSTVPSSVSSDPTVDYIEWEPATAPISQTLTVVSDNQLSADWIGYPFTVLLEDGVGAHYQPAAMTAATMAAKASPGTITPAASGAYANANGSFVNPPLTFNTSARSFAIALMDRASYTQNAATAVSAIGYSDPQHYYVRCTLTYQYRPRYRIHYKAAASSRVNTWVRTVQRGDMFAGAPRTVQNNSQQASLRNIGFR